MCQLLSLISDGKGNIKYFDYAIRQKIIHGKLKGYEVDSHQSLCDYFGDKNMKVSPELVIENKTWNWYEYNPLSQELKLDQRNLEVSDFDKVLEKCKKLDFSLVVPELVIKLIINPLLIIRKRTKPTKKEIALLKQYASVRASAYASVRASVYDSVCDSVSDSAYASVSASVYASVYASVSASVCASVCDSIGVYVSSFFNLKQWKGFDNLPEGVNPFQCCIDLWDAGLVPSFDGKKWRLHAGKKAEIIYEWIKES